GRRALGRARPGGGFPGAAAILWALRAGPLRAGRHAKELLQVKMHYDADCPPRLGEKVAVLGYGSQGHAHALNLQESGEDVRVGLYPGSKSWAKAEKAGLRVMEVADAVRDADVVMVLTPDVGQQKLYREAIEPNL